MIKSDLAHQYSCLATRLPGLALCACIAVSAAAFEHAVRLFTGKSWIEALVLAILIGAVLRTLWQPTPLFAVGVGFAAKEVLEGAVMIMGASMSYHAIASSGIRLLSGIAVLVALAVVGGFLLARALGLGPRMALLVACGNAICGNSAIAAIAPVIGAESDDTVTAIAFTAVMGVAVILGVPLLAAGLHLEPRAGGAFAGMVVYAVPQVLAAAAPMGPMAVQMGTLVKLLRVLMLGPVVARLSLLLRRGGIAARRDRTISLVPGFILAFLALALLRTLGLLPQVAIHLAHQLADNLSVLAMAGLGLSVDLRQLRRAGPRVALAVTLSLAMLGLLAVAVVRFAVQAA